MVTLHSYHAEENNAGNFRYVTALMIEAGVRGYPLLERTPELLSEAGSFVDYMNGIINWLVDNFPDEFRK